LFLDLLQLVLGGFWNQIFGNQAYDPRTPSFWSLSVVKNKGSKIAPKQSPQSHRLNCPPVSFAPMLIPSSYFKPQINTVIGFQIVIFGKFQVGQFDL